MPLPKQVLQISYCTPLSYKCLLQAVLGIGMGISVTAQSRLKWSTGPILVTQQNWPRSVTGRPTSVSGVITLLVLLLLTTIILYIYIYIYMRMYICIHTSAQKAALATTTPARDRLYVSYKFAIRLFCEQKTCFLFRLHGPHRFAIPGPHPHLLYPLCLF